MKTTVKNMMMGFTLMGCLVLGTMSASAQPRSRAAGGNSRSSTTQVSRPSKSSSASVSRSSSS